MTRVIVIGAGAAGLAAARTLHAAGVDTVVLDKGRKAGGRMVSRALEGLVFDYGAQYFTARAARFRELVSAMQSKGVLAQWQPRLHASAKSLAQRDVAEETWWIAPNGFSDFARALAAGIDIRQLALVRSVRSSNATASVRATILDIEEEFTADYAIITTPVPQSMAWLSNPVPVSYTGTWSVTAAWPSSLGFDFDVWRSRQHTLMWAARENSKPGRAAALPEVWSLQCDEATFRAHVHCDRVKDKELITAVLVQAFREATGSVLPAPSASHVHKWAYARPNSPVADPLREQRILAAGDGCSSGRVESAYLSGVAAANTVLALLA